ncbi:MAG: secondary thiamine-phosphate synthase enzyme YjbQ [Succinivibrionaceae bacterium]|nr:secondary thiamine-phosphate synthase enzyme YjbQ [Succinivibrionaceae bacterium]
MLRRTLALAPRPRGFHLVTGELLSGLPEIAGVGLGMLHLQLLHTSASLTLNENADPAVRADFASFFSRAVPDGAPYFEHTLEGDDDMTAHLKSSLLGTQLSLQVERGRLVLGTWQGIYLGEHRHRGGARQVSALLWGEARP